MAFFFSIEGDEVIVLAVLHKSPATRAVGRLEPAR